MAFPSGWTRRAPIVIDAVDDTLTDFPIHLDVDCFPSEALDSGSGNKANSDGSDLRFSSDISGTTELPFEVVRWVQDASAPNRKATVHVKVPSLSYTTTTTIYVWYGNSGATMPAANAANGSEAVWNSAYQGVWHLDNTSSLPSSTAGGTAGTIEGSPATTVESPVGLGLDLDGTDDAVHFGATNYNDQLVEVILKLDSTASQIIFGKTRSTPNDASWSTWVSSSKGTLFYDTDGALTYGYTLADSVNANTTDWEYWAIRNRSTAGGAVSSKALPTSEQTHQATCTDGTYMYSLGGHTGTATSPVTTHNRYNPSANTWASMAALPVALTAATATYLSGKIYLFGGATTSGTTSNRTDIYDVAGDSWSTGTNMPAAVVPGTSGGQASCTDGTYVYVTINQKLERYDPSGDSWTTMADAALLGPNTFDALIYDNGYIYLIGRDYVDRYDISGDSWNSVSHYDNCPTVAWARVVQPVGDGTWLVGFGRQSSGEQLTSLYNYDPVTKVWTKLRSYDAPINACASVIASSKLYVYGMWAFGRALNYSFGHHACYNLSSGDWETLPALVDFYRGTDFATGQLISSPPYAGNGNFYIGRQDNYASSRSGAKIAEVRRSNSARSKAWMRASKATLISASTFAAVGTAVQVGGGVILSPPAIAPLLVR